MAKFDDALAAVFKHKTHAKKDEKEREVQLKHFKMRSVAMTTETKWPSLLVCL